MLFINWINEDLDVYLNSFFTSLIMLFVIIIVTRINGLRSFAKITPIDFAVTITIGSVLSATIVSDSNSIGKGVLIIIMLIVMQTVFGWLKAKFKWFDKVAFNEPLFMMRNGKFLDDNINNTKMSRSNILAKLRENGVAQLEDVRAVVLETTGDVSVITGNDGLDEYIVSDVREFEDDTNIKIDHSKFIYNEKNDIV